jgi:hypothetical protein
MSGKEYEVEKEWEKVFNKIPQNDSTYQRGGLQEKA